MIEALIKRALRALSDILHSKFHEEFDMTEAAQDLSAQGVRMVGSGFVYPTSTSAVGVYIVKYRTHLEENRYGRYN